MQMAQLQLSATSSFALPDYMLSTLDVSVGTLTGNATGDQIVFLMYGGIGLVEWVFFSDLWLLNVNNLVWRQLYPSGTKPPALESYIMLTANVKMFAGEQTTVLFGGWTQFEGPSNRTFIYSLHRNYWTEVLAPPSSPSPIAVALPVGGLVRAISSSTSTYGSLIFFGGLIASQQHSFVSLQLLDLATLEWTIPQTNGTYPPARSLPNGQVLLERYLIIFGGFDAITRLPYGDMWKYDALENYWSEITPVSGPAPSRLYPQMASIGQAIVMFGGEDLLSERDSDLYVYSLVNNDWSLLNTRAGYPISISSGAGAQMPIIPSQNNSAGRRTGLYEHNI